MSESAAEMLAAVRFGMERRISNQGEMPPERWTSAQVALLKSIAACENLAPIYWRAVDAHRVGDFISTLTMLAARGLLTVEGEAIRPTNLAFAACDDVKNA